MKQKLLTIFALLLTIATSAWAQEPTKYTVKMAEGTADVTNWTITPTEAAENTKVTATYKGTKRVKAVTAVVKAAVPTWDGDLAKLTGEEAEDYATATDGMTIFNTLKDGVNVKVMIAAGAKVTLKDATINGVSKEDEGTGEPLYQWAGLTCLGDATITLSGKNSVKGFYMDYPGIQPGSAGKTLTIQGEGSLTAGSNFYGAGIGGGNNLDIKCGNIEIKGGSIIATGGYGAAGIGAGFRGACGNISISGGNITATGGDHAAGIGSSYYGDCGTVTITSGVTKVTATKGSEAKNSIGVGYSKCTGVTIGGTAYYDGSDYQNGGDTYLTKSTIIYPTPALLPLNVGTATLKYAAGDTWKQAIEYYPEENAGWSLYGDYIIYKSGNDSYKVTDGTNDIASTALISSTANYSLQDALISLTIGGATSATIKFHPGDTWETAVGNGQNNGWTANTTTYDVKFGAYTLYDPEYPVDPTYDINPATNYTFVDESNH